MLPYPDRLRTRRPLAATLACFALAAAGLAATSAASAGAYNPDGLAAGRMRQIGAVCESVVGLQPGERHYVDCVTSLSHSAAKLDRVRGLQDARNACLAKGLRAGDVALSECELAATRSGSAGAAAEAVDYPVPAAHPRKSYFYASTREIRDREQQACAQIGYDPIYGPFADCVANLQGMLVGADHPMQ